MEVRTDNDGVKIKESGVNAANGGGVLSSLKMTLVLLTPIFVVLLALRNTLTYHVQHFWGASGDFWQLQWDKIMIMFGNDYYNILVYGGTIFAYIAYWVVGGIYTLMDVTGVPAFIRPYKVQPGTNDPVSTNKLIECILVVQFNQLVVGLCFSNLCYKISVLRGCDQSSNVPSFHWFLFELAFCVLIEEIGFYYSHRLFHHGKLYKYFHKIHHEWQSPIAITALYAHPLEHILSNLAPILAGPLILGSHPSTVIVWTCSAVLSTLTAHSGYHLPFMFSPEFHDYHHLKFNQCFGVLGILDHLHGTDNTFRASKNYARHVTFMSLTPPLELIPNEPHDKQY